MRCSINVLLLALSVLDLLLSLLGIPVFVLPIVFNTYDLPTAFYAYVVVSLYPLLMIVQTASLWTLVAINVERYAAVCQPFLGKTNLLSIRCL